MPRATNAPASRRRHKRVIRAAQGQYGARSRKYKIAYNAVDHARYYSYRDRKQKKRKFRELWITRINAACRLRDLSYSAFMNGLKKAGILINRKMLSELAIADAAAFDELIKAAAATR